MTTQACLSADLIARIRARIAEDWRRTGDGDWLRMPKELRPKSHANGLMGEMLGALFSYQPANVEALRPIEPLSDKAIAKIEQALGFSLPGQLRQLYEIGDGGFGPFNGVRRLSNWAKDYQKLLAEPIGEKQRAWPGELLPIVYLNGHRLCLDRDSGAVVRWTKPPSRCSEARWTASFAPQASSLGEWLERWVDTPTQTEGGPEGGWAPSAAEAERRERAGAEQQARIDAAAEKARTFSPAELPPLPEALIGRVRERAGDPRRRTWLAAAAGAAPIGLDDLEDELVKAADVIPHQAFARAGRDAEWLAQGGAAGRRHGGPGHGPRSGRRDDDDQVRDGRKARRAGDPRGIRACRRQPRLRSSRAAAAALRDRRRRVRPGRHRPVQPGRPVGRATDKLTGAPQGPSGEPWPAKLLPLYESDPALGCLDLESGKVVVYDPERMEDVHGGAWRRSFVTEHELLAGLLEAWLAAPSFADQLERRESECERPTDQPHRAFSDPAQQADAEIRYYGFLPPELRAAAGLPERGVGGRDPPPARADLRAVKTAGGRPSGSRTVPATAVRAARSAGARRLLAMVRGSPLESATKAVRRCRPGTSPASLSVTLSPAELCSTPSGATEMKAP